MNCSILDISSPSPARPHSLYEMRQVGFRYKIWGPNFLPWMLFGELSFFFSYIYIYMYMYMYMYIYIYIFFFSKVVGFRQTAELSFLSGSFHTLLFLVLRLDFIDYEMRDAKLL